MSALQYANDFLYFLLRPDADRAVDSVIYCSGVNVSRFGPITKGRHGIGANPSVRGLQLVNLGVRDLVLARGSTPKAIRGNICKGIAPTTDTWYTEALLIEKAPGQSLDGIIEYAVLNLVSKIFNASMLYPPLPDKLLGPNELQGFLDDLCNRYGGA